MPRYYDDDQDEAEDNEDEDGGPVTVFEDEGQITMDSAF